MEETNADLGQIQIHENTSKNKYKYKRNTNNTRINKYKWLAEANADLGQIQIHANTSKRKYKYKRNTNNTRINKYKLLAETDADLGQIQIHAKTELQADTNTNTQGTHEDKQIQQYHILNNQINIKEIQSSQRQTGGAFSSIVIRR